MKHWNEIRRGILSCAPLKMWRGAINPQRLRVQSISNCWKHLEGMSVNGGGVFWRSSQTLGLIIFKIKREPQLSVLIHLIELLNWRSERDWGTFNWVLEHIGYVCILTFQTSYWAGSMNHSNRTCHEISGMFIVGTTSLKLPLSGYFILVPLACDSHCCE